MQHFTVAAAGNPSGLIRSGRLGPVRVLKWLTRAGMLAITLAAAHPAFAADQARRLVAACGQPDRIESTAIDGPRSPFATKQLVFDRFKVRALYVADSQLGQSPPFGDWTLIGFQDDETKKVLKGNKLEHQLPCIATMARAAQN